MIPLNEAESRKKKKKYKKSAPRPWVASTFHVSNVIVHII